MVGGKLHLDHYFYKMMGAPLPTDNEIAEALQKLKTILAEHSNARGFSGRGNFLADFEAEIRHGKREKVSLSVKREATRIDPVAGPQSTSGSRREAFSTRIDYTIEEQFRILLDTTELALIAPMRMAKAIQDADQEMSEFSFASEIEPERLLRFSRSEMSGFMEQGQTLEKLLGELRIWLDNKE